MRDAAMPTDHGERYDFFLRGSWSVLWPSLRRSSAPNTLIRPLASTTSRSCFKAQGELAGARPLFERALAIRE